MSLYGDTSDPPPAKPRRSGALLRIIISVKFRLYNDTYCTFLNDGFYGYYKIPKISLYSNLTLSLTAEYVK